MYLFNMLMHFVFYSEGMSLLKFNFVSGFSNRRLTLIYTLFIDPKAQEEIIRKEGVSLISALLDSVHEEILLNSLTILFFLAATPKKAGNNLIFFWQ